VRTPKPPIVDTAPVDGLKAPVVLGSGLSPDGLPLRFEKGSKYRWSVSALGSCSHSEYPRSLERVGGAFEGYSG
jgi:hypothetical protein